MTPNNPLRQYFRQPAIYIRLPSGGQFYPPGTLTLTETNELPVYPMTAIDEIMYKTPDALFNGQATVNVIQSCIPNITNAWGVPAMDVDTILVAIRIASYGHEMEFGTKCPKCSAESDRALDLRTVMDAMRIPDYNQSIQSGDMEIYFRPMNYKNLNDNNQLQYENQRMLQMLPDTKFEDTEKMNALTAALKKITDITVTALAQSIATVKTPTAMVSEPEYIEDFLKNCDRNLFTQIRDHIIKLKTQAEMQPMKLACDECSHEYEQLVSLDMSNFFAPAS
jgi:hypothetical protein